MSLSSNRKSKRSNEYDSFRSNDALKRKADTQSIVGLENFDDFGRFNGFALKRRIIEISNEKSACVNKSREQLKKSKCKHAQKKLSPSLDKPNLEPKLTLSLEDYNNKGEFIGVALKR